MDKQKGSQHTQRKEKSQLDKKWTIDKEKL